jgi:hypothetical protein
VVLLRYSRRIVKELGLPQVRSELLPVSALHILSKSHSSSSSTLHDYGRLATGKSPLRKTGLKVDGKFWHCIACLDFEVQANILVEQK